MSNKQKVIVFNRNYCNSLHVVLCSFVCFLVYFRE
jgi:hypothetical protein